MANVYSGTAGRKIGPCLPQGNSLSIEQKAPKRRRKEKARALRRFCENSRSFSRLYGCERLTQSMENKYD
jgi:hypothetical protein